jgi:hypothetical protein
MSRALLASGMLVLAALLSACSQTREQSSFDQGQLPSTRAELYRQYGVPDAIRIEGEDRWLRYDHAAGKGMTLGARYWGLGLVIGRSQSQADRLWVRVAPDDRITAVEPMVASDELHYRLWPFGD